MLETRSLTFTYGKRQVLHGVSLHAAPCLTTIIGPNAAGKSTLVNCLAGQLKPEGAVLIHNRPIQQWKKKALAEVLCHMPQQSGGKALLTVLETVLLGRLPRLSLRLHDEDLNCTLAVLRELGIEHLADRSISELSGGQQQLVSIAQVLVRKPQILLMDEPTNNLDLFRQMELFQCIRDLTRKRDLTTIMVLHDLNFASRFSDRIIVLHHGAIYAVGPPEEVITATMLLDVYCIDAKIVHDDEGVRQVIPIRPAPGGRHRQRSASRVAAGEYAYSPLIAPYHEVPHDVAQARNGYRPLEQQG